MRDYKIIINVSEVGGVFSAKNIEEAEEIAQSLCDDIYARLKGKCCVEVDSIEEVSK